MGKIRVAVLGDEEEKEQKRRAEARRQTKKSKKEKVEKVGLHGGERVAVVEGTELSPEIKKLVEEREKTDPEYKEKRNKVFKAYEYVYDSIPKDIGERFSQLMQEDKLDEAFLILKELGAKKHEAKVNKNFEMLKDELGSIPEIVLHAGREIDLV